MEDDECNVDEGNEDILAATASAYRNQGHSTAGGLSQEDQDILDSKIIMNPKATRLSSIGLRGATHESI